MANKLQLNFIGGMNTKTSPLIIKDNECELALNYTLDKFGALVKRRGYTQFSNQPVVAPILGLFEFLQNVTIAGSGTKVQIMCLDNPSSGDKEWYTSSNGTNWTLRKSISSIAAGNKSRFAVFVGGVIHLDGSSSSCMSSTNGTTWNVTTAPAPDAVTTGAVMYIPVVFQDRVYALGSNSTVSGGIFSSAPFFNKVFFSSLPAINDANAITWAAEDNFDLNPDDNDAITGGENNGNRLLIFKRNAMYRWTFGQVEADKIIGVGTSAMESVRTNFDIGVTFFANPKGVFAYSGGRPKLISRKIQQYIDAVPSTSWQDVCAEVDDDHYYLSVGDITVFGKTITNAVLVYHISLDAWTIFSLADRPTVFARMIAQSGSTSSIYFGTTTGKVFKFLDGNDDGGVTIATEFVSKEYVLSYPKRTNLKWVDVFSDNRGRAAAFYDLDRLNQFDELGSLEYRITNLRVPTRECNTVRIKIADNSAAAHSIEGFNMEHDPKEKRDENQVNTRRRGME